MVIDNIFELILGGVVSVVGFFLKGVHAKVEKTNEELHEFKTHVAMNYPTKEAMDKRFDKLDRSLETLKELPSIVTVLNSEIKHISDKIESIRDEK
jgi:hypothetical protein